jgi:asparagine synthase (glutamine-hydrolysing)
MCGICGIWTTRPDLEVSDKIISDMRDRMVTRGPDSMGVTTVRCNGYQLGLGHRRLSILDLSARGHQPMSTSDGRLTIVYNGEVFNFREIRRELIDRHNCSFESDTDTEVLLYAVHTWGLDETLKRLRGMYAFALFDHQTHRLWVVRDPLGVKPLYFVRRDGFFAFASEIKALLALPWIERRLDESSMYHYLTFANAPAPETFFQGIEKLEAGMYIELGQNRQFRTRRYWDPSHFIPDESGPDETECIEEVRRLLRQAVARRMISDVPFGVFLSGGVDSSLNVALMAELMDRPVETFSVGIQGDTTNEFEYARQIAKLFGANHHETVIGDADFLSLLPRLAYLQDEPLADPVCIPLYYVSKLARDSGVTVIQVGEGSDEIFAGYYMYHLFNGWRSQVFSGVQAQPRLLRSLMRAAGERVLPAEFVDALRRAEEGTPFFLGNAIAFWDAEKAKLLRNTRVRETSSQYIGKLWAESRHADPLRNIINVELKNRLPELLLMRVDKMSMANSIETRVPFLDEDVVEFALRIPSRLKQKDGQPKYILKRAAEGLIPRDTIYRRKQGFCGSATNMLSSAVFAFARETILDSELIRERFDMSAVEKILARSVSHPRFNNFKVWNLLNLALWHDCWFRPEPRAAVA